MKFFVSRQHYYYSGEYVVEVAAGGLDFAGCDMLSYKYPGEGIEYDDPREAVKAALVIRDLWQADLPEQKIGVGVGCTMGMGVELEPDTDEFALAWADKSWGNSWKNYETWAVKLWIDNDEGEYLYWQEQVAQAKADAPQDENFSIWGKDTAKFRLADTLKEYYQENLPKTSNNVYSDLLGSALDRVDWYEIAEALLDD